MRIPKWFRRDRSNRRSSDSQAVMITSPDFDSSSPRSLDYEDPIRTDEYKKAFAEFLARRSLGPIKEDYTKEGTERTRTKNHVRSERKQSKRLSLPDTRSHNAEFSSPTNPQIQFSFNNQFYMSVGEKQAKKHLQNGSLTSTSPDLLPPRFIRDRHVDFDDANNPPSPPNDFYKDNSLPYVDRDNSIFVENNRRVNKLVVKNTSASNDVAFSSRKPAWKYLDCSVESEEDATFDSLVRKLEQMCQFVKMPNCSYFRGVPLVRCEVVEFDEEVESSNETDVKINWRFASWNNTPVTIREYPKIKPHSKKDQPFGRFISTDIDILTKIRHSNILLLMGLTYEKKNKLCTIFEDTIGTLHDYIHLKGNRLSCKTAVKYLGGIASALVYLNTNRYVHTSVSSHSILLTSSNVAKLCNFELCTQILVRSDNHSCDNSLDIYKLNYLHEPEYENVEGLKTSYDDITSEVHYECSSQNLSVRKHFSHFRWQAPELFDDIDNIVYPCTKTDVYSLCIVLWECINNSSPWKSLSYQQLLQLYLNWHQGIRLHQKDLYPQLVHDILTGGLPINPDERINIRDLHKKFTTALNQFSDETNSISTDVFSKKDNSNVQSVENYVNRNEMKQNEQPDLNPVTLQMKDIKKYQVTNLDDECWESICHEEQNSDERSYIEIPVTESKASVENLSSLRLSSKESLANTEIFLIEESFANVLQNTDSTEYRSLMTPNVKQFTNRTSNFNSSTVSSKLSFTEEYSSDREISLTNKILKLNSSLTPKSYKSLHIQAPSPDTIDNIRSLTDNFEQRTINTKDKATYSFEIQNTSLPITPIARNNKIKKNAWLSGKINEDVKSTSQPYDNYNEIKLNISENCIHDNDCAISMVTLPHSKSFSDIDTQTEIFLPDANSFRNHTIGCPTSRRCIETRNLILGNNIAHTFRRRSYSLNSKSSLYQKSSENVTGIDIKPIVAIHERWIVEARKKQGRSFSLPDNYRGLYAVKPASHLTDPARPKYAFSSPNNPLSECKSDKNMHFGCYSDVSPLVRSAVLKKRIINASSLDFFENSLWRKEKEKIVRKIQTCDDPKSSSTPKSKPMSTHSVDKCTNTESIEELCQKLVANVHKSKFNKTYDVFERSARKPNVLNDSAAIKSAKSHVLAELADTFERITKSKSDSDTHVSKDILHSSKKRKDQYLDITITLNPKPNNENKLKVDDSFSGISVFETRKIFDQTMNSDDFLSGDYCGGNVDEDSVSLPDIATQCEAEDAANTSLKRCQAFPALQDARSTEDMYIDDELPANVDMHTFGENIRLVPLESNLHEATCDKGQECCLVKIQRENNCNRLLIFCDDPNNVKSGNRRDGMGYSSDEDEELVKLIGRDGGRLEMESSASLNLIDLKSSVNKLPVIEEKSDEDRDSDRDSVESNKSGYIGSGRVVQDLISLYEGESLHKSVHESQNKSSLDKFKSSENELSIIILDDDLDPKNRLSAIKNHYDMDVKHSLIDDIIHI